LKAIFELSYTQVMLVQFAFFSAYFLFSAPWSKVVNTIGYQKTMVVGLLTMGIAAVLFVPAASVPFVPAVSDGARDSCSWYYWSPGGSESLRDRTRQTRNGIEPVESYTGFQLARHYPGANCSGDCSS
jgi:hypothetical protein